MARRRAARRHSYTRNGRTYYRGAGGPGIRQSGGKGSSSYSVQGTGPLLALGAFKAAKWALPKLGRLAVWSWTILTATEGDAYRHPANRPAPAYATASSSSRPASSRRMAGLCTAHGSSYVPTCRGCERAAG